jgi:WD40 repeat protein
VTGFAKVFLEPAMFRPLNALCVAILSLLHFQVQVCRAEELKERATVQENGTGRSWIAFTPDGKTLAWTSRTDTTGSVNFWDLAENKQLDSLEEAKKGTACFAFSPDGKSIALGAKLIPTGMSIEERDFVTEVKLVRIPSAKELAVFKGNGNQGVDHLAFSNNGEMLAAISSGDTPTRKVKIWEVNSGKLKATLQDAQPNRPASGSIYVFSSFLPGDKTLVVVGSRAEKGGIGVVETLAVPSGKLKDTSIAYLGMLFSTALTKDGKILALGGGPTLKGPGNSDKDMEKQPPQVILWDIGSRKQKGAIKGFTKTVTALAFSPNGKIIATGSNNHIKLWDVAKGKEIAEAELTSDNPVYKLAFSPDGKTLASVTGAYSIKLWEVPGIVENKKP